MNKIAKFKEIAIPSLAVQKYRTLIAFVVIKTVGVILPQPSLTNAGEQQNLIHHDESTKYLMATPSSFHLISSGIVVRHEKD